MSKLGVTPWDIVRVVPMEAGGFVDAHTSFNSEAKLQKFIDQNGDLKTARFMTDTEGQKFAIKDSLPSLYTGGMRKLMQVAHLRGASAFYAAGYDQLLPNWADTYGVWISSPTDGYCNRYIIRICSAGVYRIPINFSRRLPADWQSIEAAAASLPPEEAAQTVGRMWSAGNFDPSLAVKIADAPLMYTNEEGLLYSTCGWAFNSDGSSAVNIGVRTDPDDPMEARKRSSLYRVDITESSGMPVSASCVLVESGELVNHFNDTDENNGTAIIQVPNPDAMERGYCHTFVCYPGAIGPRLFSTNTPVFAYFDPTDALHVVRFAPTWSGSNTNTSTTMDQARGSPQTFSDAVNGDLSGTIALYGSLDASGYNSSVLGATWGSDNRTTGITMRFTSPLVAPTEQTYVAGRIDSNFQTYGSVAASGAAYGLVFMAIEWSVTSINLTTGESVTYKDYRSSSLDSVAGSRVTAQGVISRSRSYSQDKRYHQVLVLHGYDRTSYAVYEREANYETGITISYGGVNMAVPDTATLEYNGNWSGNNWVSHTISSYHSDITSGNTRTIRTCVGVTKLPGSMLISNSAGNNSISPPAGGNESDLATVEFRGKIVVGGSVFDAGFDGPTLEHPHIDATFFYKAGGSFIPSRRFYQEKENITPANVVGVGSYALTDGNVTCFVGWF